MAAIADLRRNPFFLQFCFASLAQDELTKLEYGQNEIDRAIEWFMRTNIVVMNSPVRPNQEQFPCVTITELGGKETAYTLGDVNYDTSQELDLYWPILVGPINPVAYDRTEGTVEFSDFNGYIIVPGMLLVLKNGTELTITEVSDFTISITPTNAPLDLTNCTIRPLKPAQIASLKSLKTKMTYAIGCHAQGEPVHLHYLYSIIKFSLWKYKKTLFEGRGFENYQISSTEFMRNPAFEDEVVYTQYLQATGDVQEGWPEAVHEQILGVTFQPAVIDMELPLTEAELQEQPWIGADNDDPWTDFGADDPNLVVVTQVSPQPVRRP